MQIYDKLKLNLSLQQTQSRSSADKTCSEIFWLLDSDKKRKMSRLSISQLESNSLLKKYVKKYKNFKWELVTLNIFMYMSHHFGFHE